MIRIWIKDFGKLRAQRTERDPLRTYLKIPALRALTLWFTPRVELLPSSGHLWPVREEWQDDRRDFLVTLGLTCVNAIYLLLALVGAWIARRRPGVALLIVFCIVRTLFFARFVETPEPRYVLECFPAVIALGAQVFTRRTAEQTAVLDPPAAAGQDDSQHRCSLAFVDWLGMNGEAENLREAFFDPVFEGGGDVVNFGDR